MTMTKQERATWRVSMMLGGGLGEPLYRLIMRGVYEADRRGQGLNVYLRDMVESSDALIFLRNEMQQADETMDDVDWIEVAEDMVEACRGEGYDI